MPSLYLGIEFKILHLTAFLWPKLNVWIYLGFLFGTFLLLSSNSEQVRLDVSSFETEYPFFQPSFPAKVI